MPILKACGTKIVDGKTPVLLRGVNLGGWLMPEGYIMHAPNRGYRFFRQHFVKTLGEKTCDELESGFRQNFIMERDFERIAALGLNCIRLPFHYALIETRPRVYSEAGAAWIDQAITWAGKYGLRVILDMHAAPGAQNHDWHSDSDGQALFWKNKTFQRRAIALWQFLAKRYRDEPVVAGYDLLNEPILGDSRQLNAYYRDAIKAIRTVDRQHIVFLKGLAWAQDLKCLDQFDDDNYVLSFHAYEPADFTFNLLPGIQYPPSGIGMAKCRAQMQQRIAALKAVADKHRVPVWCGEFGVNARGGACGEDIWLKDILKYFESMNIHWTYWTWKAIKNHMFPDGVYSYVPNDVWVNRAGPLSGWDTWHMYWKSRKKEMMRSWRTEAFTVNAAIVKELKYAA
ncbi:MAG: glycoside hydrolase family 5 protein [Candidatus Omnitrophica bacterium]|nr:glycoside hydrolase family 5 protein [Candidatus Omnitrophota bacterium]